ncbi:flippase [Pectobacterium carotovorum]|uniref:flippase n=1 Tax=Pectobacterium carotovorum TaxID=554 RepID=UPI000AFC6791|nr:flippase [Pectobacterium carotovorum]
MGKLKGNRFFLNVSWNMVGFVVPILTAIIAIPFLIRNIGTERFGILTLIFAIIGFMNVFDFGLARSITKSVVKYRELKDERRTLSSIKTGWYIISAILFIISFFFFFFRQYIADSIFNSSAHNIKNEIVISLVIISFSLVFVVSQSVFSGVLEAYGAFKTIAISKIPFSLLMYTIPLLLSFKTASLIYITLSLCLLRILMAVIFYLLMNKEIKRETHIGLNQSEFDSVIAWELIRYGGWISVSNIIAPVMLYIDRFFVSAIIGVTVVAYYTTPYEIVSKISIVAASVSSVLFPILSSKIPCDIKSANGVFTKSTIGIFIALLIPVCVGMFLSKSLLSLWINEEFAENSYIVFCMFLIGFMIHGLIQPAFIWIQAAGKPYITALCHLFDLSLYVFYFPYLTKNYGILGASYAWVLRVSISFIVLHSLRFFLYKRACNENI